MANFLYNKAKQKFLGGDLALDTMDIKVVLVDTDQYVANQATDEFLTSIVAGARIATSANLANKSITDGVFDADDITLSTVTGVESEAIVIYHDSGVAGSSELIAYIDTGTGLPITPNGGDIVLQFSGSTTKIFSL